MVRFYPYLEGIAIILILFKFLPEKTASFVTGRLSHFSSYLTLNALS